MAVKWNATGKDLQAAYHETGKYGKRFDRYIHGRYVLVSINAKLFCGLDSRGERKGPTEA